MPSRSASAPTTANPPRRHRRLVAARAVAVTAAMASLGGCVAAASTASPPPSAVVSNPAPSGGAADTGGAPRVVRTDAEWRAALSPAAYDVLRDHGTERPFTSPLLREHRDGTFSCAGCGEPLFDAEHKFDSGTGWPSFWQPASGAHVDEHADRSLGVLRTEVRCGTCDGHLGHVFPDGPAPTGLRYCINGVALTFSEDAP